MSCKAPKTSEVKTQNCQSTKVSCQQAEANFDDVAHGLGISAQLSYGFVCVILLAVSAILFATTVYANEASVAEQTSETVQTTPNPKQPSQQNSSDTKNANSSAKPISAIITETPTDTTVAPLTTENTTAITSDANVANTANPSTPTTPPTDSATEVIKSIIKSPTKNEAGTTKAEPEVLPDSFGRDTPKGTVQGLLNALTENDEVLASNYLQLLPTDNPSLVVSRFKKALDAGARLQSDLQLNNTPEGSLTDKLPSHIDDVGYIDFEEQDIPLQLIRVNNAEGHQIWLFSQETLQKIPAIVEVEPTLVEQYTTEGLSKIQLFNTSLSDVMAVALLTVFGFAAVYLLVWLLHLVGKLVYPRIRDKSLPINDNVILPLAVVITANILPELMLRAGVSLTVREPVFRFFDIFGWVALTWLLFRVIDSIFGRVEKHSRRHKRVEHVAVISLARKIAKATLFIMAVIVVFGNLGFDLTTGIATLGIGGLALALGAQKTVENLVGSVVVVTDRPVRVGDLCQFGEHHGVVIDIGIRSTRVRTFERTIVTIPNGDFATMQIENFTAKDMFRFLHKLYLKRSTDVVLIQQMLKELEEFLNDHYLTNQEWNQVRIAELRQDSYVVECHAYVDANSAPEFYDKQNVVLIDLLKKVATYDVEQALPTQSLLLEESLIDGSIKDIDPKKSL